MFDSEEREFKKLNTVGMELSPNVYNLVIGVTVWYGLVCNAVMIYFLGGKFDGLNPIIFLLGYLVSCFVGCQIVKESENPFISFIGYNFVVVPIGIVLTRFVPNYSIDSIILAVSLTAGVTFAMTFLATIVPRLFEGLGRTLFFSLLFGIIAEIVGMLLGYRGDLFNWLFVIVFSLCVGVDWCKAQTYPKVMNNAVSSALDIYLDIINLFVRFLSIVGKSKSRD